MDKQKTQNSLLGLFIPVKPLTKRLINGLREDSNFFGSNRINFWVIEIKAFGLIARKIISNRTVINGDTTKAMMAWGGKLTVSERFETNGERGKNKLPKTRNMIRVNPSNTLSTNTVARPVAEDIFSRLAKK